jgi:hypothetical protein
VRFSPPNPFPRLTLPDLQGVERALARSWAHGEAVIAIGHRDCATTRLSLPFVDRLYRRRGTGREVLLILQDGREDAAALAEELGLEVPVLLEPDPYPLAAELDLRTVPTLMLVGTDGHIAAACEGFRQDDLEAFASRLGVAGPLFTEADGAPPRKPG